jgi:uncharacterized membrane protein YtjA (UPF0391 family)
MKMYFKISLAWFILALIASVLGYAEVFGLNIETGRALFMIFLITSVINFFVGIIHDSDDDFRGK